MRGLVELVAAPLGQAFVQRALVAGLALGTAGALLGVFVVQRGLGLVADGLAHATFGGLALGCCSGRRPTARSGWRCPSRVAVALGIQQLRRRTTLGGDVATGVFFAVSFAAGVLFLGLRAPRAAPANVEALLFGSLLAVSPEALARHRPVAALVVAAARVGPQLAYATFDPELARLSGVRVAALESLLLAVTALVVVVGVKTVGVVLVSAFVVIPAATAQLLGRTLGGDPGALARDQPARDRVGLLASYHLNVAPGATIILDAGRDLLPRARAAATVSEATHTAARARLARLVGGLGLEAVAAVAVPVPPGTRLAARGAAAEPADAAALRALPRPQLPAPPDLVYRPQCDGCRECRQLRVDVGRSARAARSGAA